MNTAEGISPATAFLNADGLQAVLSFLNTDADTKTIAAPRRGGSRWIAHQELMVVNNIPIFMQTQSAPAAGAAQGLATVQPNYNLKVGTTILNEVGVKLTVTPRIAGPTNVLLEVQPEISAQTGTVSETLNGQNNTAPTFSRTRIQTEASVPSGYTLVLGELDQDVTSKNYTKVPFLGDLPGLGYAFRSDSKSHQRQTILIFVTPTIIQDQDYQPSNSKFLRQKPEAPSGVPEKGLGYRRALRLDQTQKFWRRAGIPALISSDFMTWLHMAKERWIKPRPLLGPALAGLLCLALARARRPRWRSRPSAAAFGKNAVWRRDSPRQHL